MAQVSWGRAASMPSGLGRPGAKSLGQGSHGAGFQGYGSYGVVGQNLLGQGSHGAGLLGYGSYGVVGQGNQGAGLLCFCAQEWGNACGARSTPLITASSIFRLTMCFGSELPCSGITRKLSSTDHLQTDGQLERITRTLELVLMLVQLMVNAWKGWEMQAGLQVNVVWLGSMQAIPACL
eukprot:480218-Pelagomonas_calceolata.AAC.1